MSTLFQSNKNYLWGGFLGSVNITIVIFLVYKIKNTLKKEEISRKVNITVTNRFLCSTLTYFYWQLQPGVSFQL